MQTLTYPDLWRALAPTCGEGEAKAIVRTVLEVRFGLSLTDIYCGGVERLTASEAAELQGLMARLSAGEPVQYVLGEADFCGRTFRVASGVLIPRPETEELCQWIVEDNQGFKGNILDIGTGSGCIAVTLALALQGADVEAWDISPDALRIAKGNAKRLEAHVEFNEQDALAPPTDKGKYDIIVSNPPYICAHERQSMERNVLDHEPYTALFVPDDAPLLFYRAIATYAAQALRPGGSLYFEINPIHAADLEAMLRSLHYNNVELRRDQFGKWRMAKVNLSHENQWKTPCQSR